MRSRLFVDFRCQVLRQLLDAQSGNQLAFLGLRHGCVGRLRLPDGHCASLGAGAGRETARCEAAARLPGAFLHRRRGESASSCAHLLASAAQRCPELRKSSAKRNAIDDLKLNEAVKPATACERRKKKCRVLSVFKNM